MGHLLTGHTRLFNGFSWVGVDRECERTNTRENEELPVDVSSCESGGELYLGFFMFLLLRVTLFLFPRVNRRPEEFGIVWYIPRTFQQVALENRTGGVFWAPLRGYTGSAETNESRLSPLTSPEPPNRPGRGEGRVETAPEKFGAMSGSGVESH